LSKQQPLPEIDECRLLILKMIEQTVRDYLNLENSPAPIERWYFEAAECFLFEEEYRVDWGGCEKSLKDFLDIIDIDIDWFRDNVHKLKNKKSKQIQKTRLLDDDTPETLCNHRVPIRGDMGGDEEE